MNNPSGPANAAVRARRAWQVTLVLYAGLIAAIALDHALLRNNFFWPVWLVQTAPLLLVAPGLWRQHYRSGIWLCFMILFHFLVVVDNAAITPHKLAYSAMGCLIIALFCSSLLFARWQARV